MKYGEIMKYLLGAMFAFVLAMSAQGQDISYGDGAFDAMFEIDSTFTRDGGKTFEVSASGEAGDYGRTYLSYTFTDEQRTRDRGEFTGFAWAQNGEEVNTATLRGVWKKSGKIFNLYTLDIVSNGKINIGSGEVDFVAKTIKFKVSELKTD
jgi:hypothetical protein